jgi:hypothetical protein
LSRVVIAVLMYHWIYLVQDRGKSFALMNRVKYWEALEWLSNCWFLKDSASWSHLMRCSKRIGLVMLSKSLQSSRIYDKIYRIIFRCSE